MSHHPRIERRYLPSAEIRLESDHSRTLVGYAAVFNSLSQDLGGFREVIKPGAFSASLKDADIRALVDHETCQVLGRSASGTLRLSEDDHGLRVEIDLPGTSFANDLVESISRGDVDGMSFGFECHQDDWQRTDSGTVRTLLAVQVFEVSVVTFPAYLDATVALRSLKKWQQHPNLGRARRILRLATLDT